MVWPVSRAMVITPLAPPARRGGGLDISIFKLGDWKRPKPAPQIAMRQTMFGELGWAGSSARAARPALPIWDAENFLHGAMSVGGPNEHLGRSRNGVHAEALQMSPGFSAIAIPVRDQTGAAIACITINGPVYPSKKIRAQLEIRDGLERIIAATPERFVSPFAHIPANKLRLQIPRTKSAVGTHGKPILKV